jgi:cytochrome c biogenesis protein CcmG/thiol:disulfide interchange protein DsbE
MASPERTAARRVRALAVVCAAAVVPALLTSLGRIDPIRARAAKTKSADAKTIIVRREDGPLVGKVAPAFSFRTFDNQTASSRKLRGRIIVLNFFASWCPTCERELPQLASLGAVIYRHGRVVAVAVRDDPAAAKALIDRTAGEGLVLAGADKGDAIANRYLVLGAPGTVVIAPDGKVVADWRGPVGLQQLYTFLKKTFPEIESGAGA